MKKGFVIFAQIVTILIGLGVLGLMLWEPHLEGRNAHATLFEIYFQDPFLAYVYFASLPFFVAIFHMCKILEYAGQDKLHTLKTIQAVRTIKHCALSLIGFIALAEVFILLNTSDDRAGGVFMGLLAALGSTVVAAIAARCERILQHRAGVKS